MTRTSALSALVFLAATLQAGIPPQKSKPLTTPFTPPRTTVLVADGTPQAVVLVPSDAAVARLAQAFVARFEKLSGVRLPTLPEADVAKKAPRAATLIAFGNSATGPLALRLYANRLIGSDAVYPGVDGHELRTIPFALDIGANILFMGGSTPKGVSASIDALFARVKRGRTIAVPYTIDWVCPKRRRAPPLSDADIEKRVADTRGRVGAFRRYRFRSACSQFIEAAKGFYRTGDDSYGRLAARLVGVLGPHYAKRTEKPPTFILHQIAMALDQVDDSAGMSPAARLQAAEWLRQMVEDTMVFWEMRHPVRLYNRGEQSLVWNHQTYPARSVAHAATYLKTRYGVAAADFWLAVVENMFAGQIACDQPLEDSANYQWSVPYHTIDYVIATGRLRRYFTTGALASCLDYCIASHDSLGNEATHGDAWHTFASSAGALLARAATLYADPRCQWLLRRTTGATSRMWAYPTHLEPKEPTGHTGLRVFTVHPARVEGYGIQGIPPGRALDKAVFRSGWDPDAEYMMLDGLHVGNHKHLDANAIIRYSVRRRYWLVDMDYIRAAPKHHNSIVVVRDGLAPDQRPVSRGGAQVIAAQPFAAELLASAGTRDAALTQSRLNACNGLDWTRSIFWQARDFFVVVDTLTARQEGDYIVRCIWRTLGDAALEGNSLHVRQRGLKRVGSDDLEVVDHVGRRVVHFLTRKATVTFERDLQPGSYRVDMVARGVSPSADSLWLRVDDGARLAYHTPIGSYGASRGTHEKATPGPTVTIAKAGVHHFVITLREAPGVRLDRVVLTPDGGQPLTVEAEDAVKSEVRTIDEPEQHFRIVNADGAALKLRRSFDYGTGGRDGYYATYPYADKITKVLTQTKVAHLRKGDTLTFANLFTVRGDAAAPRELRPLGPHAWAVTGDVPAVVVIGPAKLDGLEVDEGLALLTPSRLLATDGKTLTPQQAAALVAELTRKPKPAPTPTALPSLAAPGVAVGWRAALGAPVTALAAGQRGVLCGGHGGELALLDRAGKPVWRHDAGSWVRSVAFATFKGGRRVCLVGTHDGRARALDAATGRELWSYTCERYSSRSGSVATLFAADLDGDGGHEVVAGSNNWHYHGLSDTGKLLWRTTTVHASTVGCAGDVDGDGRDDVAAGTEYYWPRVLASSGKQIGRSSGGPVTSAVAIVDLDGDGKGEPLFGMEDCFVRCARGNKQAWSTNVGGAATALAPLDIDADGKPEIICGSESFSVYALRADGSVAWRTQLPESVNALAVVGARIVAACDDGRVYTLDRSGKVIGATTLPAPATLAARLDDSMAIVAAGQSIVAIPVGK